MRIEDSYMAGIGASGLNRTQAADAVDRRTAQGAGAKAGAQGGDEVQLSDLAERLQDLSAKLEETSDGSAAREAKLDELALRVENRAYNPDPEALSEQLIEGMKAEPL